MGSIGQLILILFISSFMSYCHPIDQNGIAMDEIRQQLYQNLQNCIDCTQNFVKQTNLLFNGVIGIPIEPFTSLSDSQFDLIEISPNEFDQFTTLGGYYSGYDNASQ